ncbi:cytochrome P450 [Nocardia sp. CDC153]|uniref:cytochrome P450 n=1 Tax=Nocardia sp. CDC153 TaxID=3112167 RepID=UPI002DBBE1BA|nr:cytochrome P450 [Nocardia sp. CDC153]MEC3956868.1 cytochrome P450 [Nocardia sp. CDC153]
MTISDIEKGSDTTTLPPGPKLPAVVQTLLFTLARHRIYPIFTRRYGSTFLIKPTAPYRNMVVLGSPEDIKTVFAGSPAIYHAGDGNAIMRPVMGPHAVLVTDEDEHKRVRRLLTPAFGARALNGYRDGVTELVRAQVASWPEGRPFAALNRLQDLMLEVILTVVLGVTAPDRLAQLRPAILHITEIDPITLMGLHYPKLARVRPWRTHWRHQRKFDEIVYAEIAERRVAADLHERTDVLSRLVQAAVADPDGGLSDAELRDQLISLLLAGHDTTAVGLAWTLHELVRRPDQLAAAQRAADAGDDEYLGAVGKEALRIKPVIQDVARQLTAPVELGGYRLPAGITVLPAIGIVHADPGYHPEPSEFRPERFLGEQPPANTWIPFGGGARRCPGAGFAAMEMTVLLREMLSTYDLRPAEAAAEKPKARNILTVPAKGARVVALRRRDPKAVTP